jgi:8-oxo-dGTP pyrophosphatase MutT (NUDIX family)
MNLEPQKFFIGLVDFFSIILPGALLTYFLREDLGSWILGSHNYGSLNGNAAVAAFLFSSYLLGHFVFLLGSWILDWFYDQVRDATNDRQIARLAQGGELSSALLRKAAGWWLKRDIDKAVSKAEQIKAHYLGPLGAESSINAFQWAKARLTLEAPASIATVQRFEADEKFFRSLVVVLAILIPCSMLTDPAQIGTAVTSVPLLLLALWRYVDQRAKATSQAYWFVITAEGARDAGYCSPKPGRSVDAPTHAGGVVYRLTDEREPEFLLVQARRDPADWVLPKGHIEPDEHEHATRTAVREVREETGVWASVRAVLDKNVHFEVPTGSVSAQFFLMEALEQGDPADQEREIEWLSLTAALDKATYKESHRLIRLADQRIRSPRQVN